MQRGNIASRLVHFVPPCPQGTLGHINDLVQSRLELLAPQEHEELGVTYTWNFKSGTATNECPGLVLVFKDVPSDRLAETIANSKLGDKVAGWPA